MLEGWARPRPAQEAGRGLLARPPSARLQSHCFLEVSSPPPVAESCLRTRCSGPPGGRKPSSCWPASSQRPRACSRAHPLMPWVLGRCWVHGPQLQWEAQAGQAAQSVGSCPRCPQNTRLLTPEDRMNTRWPGQEPRQCRHWKQKHCLQQGPGSRVGRPWHVPPPPRNLCPVMLIPIVNK